VTESGLVVFGSEVGMIDLPFKEIVESSRLMPGETIFVDPEEGRVKKNDEILEEIASEFSVEKEVRRKLYRLKLEKDKKALNIKSLSR
jgi:glutamate synthase (NADPH/NADH) large chain